MGRARHAFVCARLDDGYCTCLLDRSWCGCIGCISTSQRETLLALESIGGCSALCVEAALVDDLIHQVSHATINGVFFHR